MTSVSHRKIAYSLMYDRTSGSYCSPMEGVNMPAAMSSLLLTTNACVLTSVHYF